MFECFVDEWNREIIVKISQLLAPGEVTGNEFCNFVIELQIEWIGLNGGV